MRKVLDLEIIVVKSVKKWRCMPVVVKGVFLSFFAFVRKTRYRQWRTSISATCLHWGGKNFLNFRYNWGANSNIGLHYWGANSSIEVHFDTKSKIEVENPAKADTWTIAVSGRSLLGSLSSGVLHPSALLLLLQLNHTQKSSVQIKTPIRIQTHTHTQLANIIKSIAQELMQLNHRNFFPNCHGVLPHHYFSKIKIIMTKNWSKGSRWCFVVEFWDLNETGSSTRWQTKESESDGWYKEML